MLVVCPKGVGGDILNDDLLSGKSRGTARTDGRTDRQTIDRAVIGIGQIRRRAVKEPLAIGAQKQRRCNAAAARLFFNHLRKDFEDRFGRRAGEGRFEGLPLRDKGRPAEHLLRDFRPKDHDTVWSAVGREACRIRQVEMP